MSSAEELVSFAELSRGGALAVGDGYRAKLEELGGTGPIFLRAGKLSSAGIDWTAPERFFDELTDRVASKMGRPGDTLITTKGNSVGRSGYVQPGSPPFVYSPHLSYWRSLDHARLDPGFLRYWARGPELRGQLNAMAHGTDMAPYLSLVDQNQLVITLPDIGRQNGIAKTLGALDEKIESNRRVQEHASALVDALARLMLDTNAMHAVGLSELVEFNRLTLRPGTTEADVLYVDIASVSPGRVDEVTRTTWREAPSRARRGVSDGDIMYSTVRPGRRSFAQVLDPDERTVVSTGFAVMSPTAAIGSSLLTTVAASVEFAAYLESVAHGSAYPAVSVAAMGNYSVEVPVDAAVVATFEATTMPLRRRAHHADHENRALARLRDTLLPELLSGRIRVPEAREAVQEAVG